MAEPIPIPTDPRFQDLRGLKFNHLEVLEYAGKDERRNHYWLCKCDCGAIKRMRGADVKFGKSKSCRPSGCFRKVAPKKQCEFPGCGRPIDCKGLCTGHKSQLFRGLKLFPLFSTKRPNGRMPCIHCEELPCTIPNLFGPCHIYQGLKDRKGYGLCSIKRKTVRVHRYIWECEVGPIPDGMVIDHVCRNRACCNVDHLRVVTPTVNSTENVIGTSWQINRDKTHCKHGHLFDEANTKRDANGNRSCRECTRIRSRIRKLRIKQMKFFGLL